MQELIEDFYAVLGVEDTASPDDIRKAYLKLAKKLHPDRFPNDPEKKAAAQIEFAKVTRAHEVLGDPRQREEYDALRGLQARRAALDEAVGSAGSTAVAGSAAAASGERSGSFEKPQQFESKAEWAAKHHVRANEFMQRKKFQEAETACKEAIRLDPAKTKYRIQLAEIYIARGWKTLAMTEIQTALRLNPDDADAKTLEMRLKAAKTSSDKAAADSKKASGGFLDQLSKLLGKK